MGGKASLPQSVTLRRSWTTEIYADSLTARDWRKLSLELPTVPYTVVRRLHDNDRELIGTGYAQMARSVRLETLGELPRLIVELAIEDINRDRRVNGASWHHNYFIAVSVPRDGGIIRVEIQPRSRKIRAIYIYVHLRQRNGKLEFDFYEHFVIL